MKRLIKVFKDETGYTVTINNTNKSFRFNALDYFYNTINLNLIYFTALDRDGVVFTIDFTIDDVFIDDMQFLQADTLAAALREIVFKEVRQGSTAPQVQDRFISDLGVITEGIETGTIETNSVDPNHIKDFMRAAPGELAFKYSEGDRVTLSKGIQFDVVGQTLEIGIIPPDLGTSDTFIASGPSNSTLRYNPVPDKFTLVLAGTNIVIKEDPVLGVENVLILEVLVGEQIKATLNGVVQILTYVGLTADDFINRLGTVSSQNVTVSDGVLTYVIVNGIKFNFNEPQTNDPTVSSEPTETGKAQEWQEEIATVLETEPQKILRPLTDAANYNQNDAFFNGFPSVQNTALDTAEYTTQAPPDVPVTKYSRATLVSVYFPTGAIDTGQVVGIKSLEVGEGAQGFAHVIDGSIAYDGGSIPGTLTINNELTVRITTFNNGVVNDYINGVQNITDAVHPESEVGDGFTLFEGVAGNGDIRAAEAYVTNGVMSAETIEDVTNTLRSKYSTTPLIATWETTAINETITLPLSGTGYDFLIDWGDGVLETHKTDSVNHEYAAIGTYAISIYPVQNIGFPVIRFDNSGDKDKILSVDQWGSNIWSELGLVRAFFGCSNLQILAIDAPDLTICESLDTTFRNCTNLTSGLSSWDVGNITNFSSMVQGCILYNEDLPWDMSNAGNLFSMFASCALFNGDISGWNFTRLDSLRTTFFQADAFNSDISGWNVSTVTNMRETFYLASSFNQPIGSWDTGNVVSMLRLLANAVDFNRDISGWNVSSNNNLQQFILGAASFTTVNYDLLLNINTGWPSQTVKTGQDTGSITPPYTANEVESGTTDGANAFELVDTTKNFIGTVNIGDVIYNITAGTYARVTGVMATMLMLDVDIMLSGQAYSVQTSDAAKGKAKLLIDDNWAITDGGYV